MFLSMARSVSLLTMSVLAIDASIGGGRPVGSSTTGPRPSGGTELWRAPLRQPLGRLKTSAAVTSKSALSRRRAQRYHDHLAMRFLSWLGLLRQRGPARSNWFQIHWHRRRERSRPRTDCSVSSFRFAQCCRCSNARRGATRAVPLHLLRPARHALPDWSERRSQGRSPARQGCLRRSLQPMPSGRRESTDLR